MILCAVFEKDPMKHMRCSLNYTHYFVVVFFSIGPDHLFFPCAPLEPTDPMSDDGRFRINLCLRSTEIDVLLIINTCILWVHEW